MPVTMQLRLWLAAVSAPRQSGNTKDLQHQLTVEIPTAESKKGE